MRLKDLEKKGVRIEYWNKNNDLNTIHGKLAYVSKDRVIVMVAVESNEQKTVSLEHNILRNRIKSFAPAIQSKKQEVNNGK
jgi:hypothetical protein